MNQHTRKAMQMLEEARPASGYRPETPVEWARLLEALEELGYAMYRENGLSSNEARRLAQKTHGGQFGLLLLEIGFSEDSNE
jgi:hypothetical protein